MEEEFYATLKLKTGEEIFSKVSVCKENGKTKLILLNPVTLDVNINQRGKIEYKVSSWLKTTTEDTFIINFEDVLTITETDSMEMIMMHDTFIRKAYKNIESPKILSRKMGYLSSVSNAKKLLEKIYKNS